MSAPPDLPRIVSRAFEVSRRAGYVSFCRNETGRLLAVSPSNMKMIMLRARRRLQAHLARTLGPRAAKARIEPRAASVG